VVSLEYMDSTVSLSIALNSDIKKSKANQLSNSSSFPAFSSAFRKRGD
jgi:hypothetical protein